MMNKIKEMSPMERPREKLMIYGAEILSDAELLAIVFGSGNRNLPVLAVCQQLLKNIKLSDIADAGCSHLRQTKGIGQAKALTLLAIVELGKRLHQQPLICLADDLAVTEQVRPVLEASDGLCYLLVLMTAERGLLAICELGSVLPDLPRTLSLINDAGAKCIQLSRNGWPRLCRLETNFQRNLELACGSLNIIVHDFLIPGS